MEMLRLIIEATVVLASILLGVRTGGVGIGLWGGVGTAILVFGFNEAIGSPPIDALLIIVAVILATSTLQASGGIDWMILMAAKVIVRYPRSVTIAAANFDTTGTTKLGRRLYDHSFFIPSLLVTVLTLVAGAAIGSVMSSSSLW